MNIDTLNAYCGNELVSFPYLAQGRLNIHQTVCAVCTGLPLQASRPKRCLKVYRAEFATTQLLDLTVWVGLFADRTCMAPESSTLRAAQHNFRPEIR